MSSRTTITRRAPRALVAAGWMLALALVAMAGLAPAAAAQQQGSPSEDERTLASYRLTMPTVQKATKASENLYEVMLKDVGLRRQIAADAEDAEANTDMTIAKMSARYDRYPQVKRAITSAGLSTREYTTAQLAMLQAMMVVGFQDPENTGKPLTIPDGVSRENVAFVQKHWTELQRMGARAESLRKQLEAQEAAAEADVDEEPPGEEP